MRTGVSTRMIVGPPTISDARISPRVMRLATFCGPPMMAPASINSTFSFNSLAASESSTRLNVGRRYMIGVSKGPLS